MPFTFAHPLYAAPLKLIKPKYVSLTGIILGSMSPDFEYFIALEPYQTIGHTAKGLLLQAIPLSIVFAFIFHCLIKEALAANAPGFFNLDGKLYSAQKTYRWKLDTLYHWLIFLISVVIGFYSHVLVDSFTHKSGYYVARLGLLQGDVLGIPVYKWLQHSLSIAGLLVQAAIIVYLLSKVRIARDFVKARRKDKLLYWMIVGSTTVITILAKIILSTSTNYIGMLVVSSISGCMLGIILASIAYRLTKNH